MKIPIITKLFQYWGRKRLRRTLRGYRFLKTLNQLGRIAAVSQMLTNTKLSQCESLVSKLIFGAGLKDAERIIRQYLLLRLGGLNLNKALLYASGKSHTKVVYPLPIEWRKILRQHGFIVAEWRSALLFNVYVFLLLMFGFILFLRRLPSDIKEIIRP